MSVILALNPDLGSGNCANDQKKNGDLNHLFLRTDFY